MTTGEPPEPLTVKHSEIILFKQILQQIDGPAARHFVYSVYSVDFYLSCPFVLFVVLYNVDSILRIFGSFASMLRQSCTCTLARIRFCPSSRTL